MTSYFIEFAIANFIFFVIYVLLLQKETNFQFRRGYLLFTSLLSLLIPLIELPTVTQVKQINLVNVLPEVLIPTAVNAVNTTNPVATTIDWLEIGYLAIAGIIALRFLISLFRIYEIYKSSRLEKIEQTSVFTTDAVSSNFTFLNFIFLSRQQPEIKPEIILHEKAHVKYGHSIDLLFLNLLVIVFWWVPTVWLFLKEIKLVHEYQADEYVVNRFDFNTYKTTLITTKLNEQGLYLTNYFNDNQLSKRINTMKNLKLKIRSWKLSMLALSLLMTVYFFACQEQSMTELVGDENIAGEVLTTVDQNAAFPGGMTALISYISTNLKYPKEAEKAGIEGKVMVEFIANKDGSISDVKVLKGIGSGCDEEAARVVKNSINWIPAEHNGAKVRQKLVLPISFMLTGNSSTSADSSKPQLNEVNLGATYPGGLGKFAEFLGEHLQYPAEAKEKGIEGAVHIELTVGKDGKVGNVKVLRGIGAGCDEEAIRVVSSSPQWNPKLDEEGNAVATTLVLPIKFQLPE